MSETSALPLKEETIRRPQCLFWFSKLESGVVSVMDAVYVGKLPSRTTYGMWHKLWNFVPKGQTEPPILCRSSNTSTGWCADTANWEVVPWELVSPPWQWSCSLCLENAGISGKWWHDCGHSSFTLPRSIIMCLFLFPEWKLVLKRGEF